MMITVRYGSLRFVTVDYGLFVTVRYGFPLGNRNTVTAVIRNGAEA